MSKPTASQLPIDQRLAYSLVEAAALLGIERRTLHDALARREFKAVKRCGRWMILRSELVRWLSEQ